MLWLLSRHSHKLRGEGLGAKQGILPMKEPSAKQMSSGNKTLCNVAANISCLPNKNNYTNLIVVKIICIWALQSQGPHKYVNSINSFLVTSSIELWTALQKKCPRLLLKKSYEAGGLRDWRTNLMKETVRLAAFGNIWQIFCLFCEMISHTSWIHSIYSIYDYVLTS